MIVPDTLFTGKTCIHLEEIESTNTYAADLLTKSSPPEGTCIISDFQTAGKGQIGRYWHSTARENLLITYIYYPTRMNIKDQFLLNIISSLAVYDVVSQYVSGVKIKWPNDIYVHEKKIAGILVQNTLRNTAIKSCIIGIGINVNEKFFPSAIPNPTSLALETDAKYEVLHIMACVSARLEQYYLTLKTGKYETLKHLYHQRLFRKGMMSPFQDTAGNIFEGEILGIQHDGKLILNSAVGKECCFGFGEIKYLFL